MRWTSALQSLADFTPDAKTQMSRVLLAHLPRFGTPKSAAEWTERAAHLRQRLLDEVYLRGWPAAVRTARPRVEWSAVLQPEGAPYRIRKLRYEIYPDYWVPALLYEPHQLHGRVPVVLNPNGHHRGGKAAMYKQARCANLARRGMLALNFEFIGMSELEADGTHNQQAYLSLVGLRGTGLFLVAMQRGLDVLLDHPHADTSRVAMTGLSGGGWQTIVLSALDPRITCVIPVAGYTAMWARIGCRSDIGDYEQAPPDLGLVADYDTFTALLAPRPTLIILNDQDDCCFTTARAKPVIYDALRPTFALYGVGDDGFALHGNADPGTHNYDADNRCALYRFLNRHFGLDSPATDLHTPAEIYREEELKVGLPESQTTVADLATRLARRFALTHRAPASTAEREALRERLRAVLRLPHFVPVVKEDVASGRLRRILLTIGPWTVPVVLHRGRRGQPLRLVLADQGVAELFAKQPPPADCSAAVADLLGCGPGQDNWQRLMLFEAAGERVLGHQVAQALAIAEAVLKLTGAQQLEVDATGPVTSFVALLAAGFAPERFSRLVTAGLPASLRLPLEWRLPYEQILPLCCPDLLTVADTPQIRALVPQIPHDQRLRAVRAD